MHFCAPLASDGAIDATEAAGWGANWPTTPALVNNVLQMPPGRFVGNVRELSITSQFDELNVPDYTDRGEGEDADVIQAVTGTIALYGHCAGNLADYLRGVARQSTGAVRAETIHTGGASLPADTLLPSGEIIDTGKAIAVTPSWADWAEGIQWVREATGIRLLQGVAGPAGSSITLSYTTEGEAYWVEAFERPRVHIGLVYAGVNKFDGTPARVDCYRAQLRPQEDFAVINSAAGELRLSFRLQPVRPVAQPRARWFRMMRGRQANG